MSETSSDTNGESGFEFLNDGHGLKDMTSQNQNSQPVIESIPKCVDEKVNPEDSDSWKSSPQTSPIEATINVPLQESDHRLRSDSLGSGLINWLTNNQFITKVAERAKNSVDTMITTLDPGMKQIIYSGGDINIIITSDKESKISPIRESFQKVFGRATVSGISSQPLSIASQPVGYESGLKAAEERIRSLRMNTNRIPQNQVVISVENFIVDICADRWYDMGCLILDDPVQGINLRVYTQPTPIPNECVNQLRFETPIDYASKSTGYAITTGSVMSKKLNVSPDEWHKQWIGISRKDLILQSAIALATLYKNSLNR